MTTLALPGEIGTALIDRVRATIAEHGDADRADSQQRYMKSVMPYRGVTAPILREALRPLLADPDLRLPTRPAWEATVQTLWDDAAYREERYAAIALTGHPTSRGWQDSETMRLYEHLITTGAWWDLVDPLAADRVGPIVRENPEVEGLRLREWACGRSLWLRRTAIISQLGAEGATDTDLLTDCIEPNLQDPDFSTEFFIRKAIGWALRQYSRTDPDWVREFVADHHDRLSGLSRREALKHL